MIAVDANVLIKAYVPEVLSENAEKMLQETGKQGLMLVVPDLIFPEIGNILWKKSRLNELTNEEVNEILGEIISLPVKVEPSRSLACLAIEIAMAHGITMYDSIYFSLALVYKTKLITADRKLVARMKAGEFGRHIEWLGHYA